MINYVCINILIYGLGIGDWGLGPIPIGSYIE